MDNIFAAVKSLIQQLSNLYPAPNIFKGFNNSVPIPANNNFVIMNALPSIKSHSLLPVYNYDTDTEQESWLQIDEVSFQVDFYGPNAVTVSALLRAALQSAYATNYFRDNNFDCVVGEVRETFNLTNTIDRDMFTNRYSVSFSIQFNNLLTVTTPSFDEATFDIIPIQI